jgi:hypothetical protein
LEHGNVEEANGSKKIEFGEFWARKLDYVNE